MGGEGSVGIIGGNGALGGAIARALLSRGVVAPDALWIAGHGRAAPPPALARCRQTTDAAALVAASPTVILSVPPAAFGGLGLDASGRLVISVMAGVPLPRLAEETGARAVIRAMSSPAAADGMAYSPWCAGPGVTAADKATARRILDACGKQDEVDDEALLDVFTALTGPVPGFVACFAEMLSGYAESRGVPPAIADRAVRQLFDGAGRALAASGRPPAAHVDEMIDYAGTTAAGLAALRAGPVSDLVAEALDASVAKARAFGRGET